MATNKKYALAKKMLEVGEIKNFEELADLVPLQSLANDIGINDKRLKRLFKNVGEIMLGELVKMAEVLKVDIVLLRDLTIPEAEGKVR